MGYNTTAFRVQYYKHFLNWQNILQKFAQKLLTMHFRYFALQNYILVVICPKKLTFFFA